jgi:hypothetical protein
MPYSKAASTFSSILGVGGGVGTGVGVGVAGSGAAAPPPPPHAVKMTTIRILDKNLITNIK